jgi:hypothetical protein
MGLVGNPARLYPGLGTIGVKVEIPYTVAARGYITRQQNAELVTITGFPNFFAPKDQGVLAMHRTPFVIRGRIAAVKPGFVEQ